MKSCLSTQLFPCGAIFALGNDQYLLGYGKRHWHKDIPSQLPCWYAPDFFLKAGCPWFTHEYVECLSKDNLRQGLSRKSAPGCLCWESPYDGVFEQAFGELEGLFQQGLLNKAVPYIIEKTTFRLNSAHIEQMLLQGLDWTDKSPLALYGFWDAQEGVLGATPEILFDYSSEKTLETMACAGTRPSKFPLSVSQMKKLHEEHAIVVHSLLGDLGDLGEISYEETKWKNFNNLDHLVTPIKVACKKFNFQKIVRSLHPTPAVGAYPKQEGMNWLRSYNLKVPRLRYGAPIGCLLEQRALCLVGIRNIQWEKDAIMLAAGCGIVQGSNFKEEKQEIADKISTIKQCLNL